MQSAFLQPVSKLRKETAWILYEFCECGAQFGTERLGQFACEMAVIRLHDSWTRFCRELIITSALGNTLTLGGTLLTKSSPSVTDRNSVITSLLAAYPRRRRFEPRWGDAIECLDAARRLGIRNLATVSAGLGATNSPAEEIRHIRNFYAHRKMGAAQRAIATNLFVGDYPRVTDLLAYTAGGIRIIDSWVQRLMLVATASIQ